MALEFSESKMSNIYPLVEKIVTFQIFLNGFLREYRYVFALCVPPCGSAPDHFVLAYKYPKSIPVHHYDPTFDPQQFPQSLIIWSCGH